MNFLSRFRANRRRKRRIKAAKADTTPLREFVYLDDVSVYSLLASRKGPLATEYTDTQTNSLSSELDGKVGVNAAVVSSEVASKLASAQSQSSQVLRKSTIQAAFKELREGEEDRLIIQSRTRSIPPQINSWEQLEKSVASSSIGDWIIRPDELERGGLIEVEVQLEADAIFRATSIITTVRSIIEENSEVFSPTYSSIQEVAALNRILDNLLAGLIPVRCRAIDYQVVEIRGTEYLVHNEIIAQLPKDPKYAPKRLYIVGVTEERLFWKDIRRVLFADLHFQAMCRLTYSGFRKTWVPVKLVNVLRDIFPDLAQQIEQLGQAALNMRAMVEAQEKDTKQRKTAALVSYGLNLSAYLGGEVKKDEIIANCTDWEEPEEGDLQSQRAAFDVVTRFVSEKLGKSSPDRLTTAQLRSTALESAGLGLSTDSKHRQAPLSKSESANKKEEFVLDTEIVAIYW